MNYLLQCELVEGGRHMAEPLLLQKHVAKLELCLRSGQPGLQSVRPEGRQLQVAGEEVVRKKVAAAPLCRSCPLC